MTNVCYCVFTNHLNLETRFPRFFSRQNFVQEMKSEP